MIASIVTLKREVLSKMNWVIEIKSQKKFFKSMLLSTSF